MEELILQIIEHNGPSTGSQLAEISGLDPLLLLRSCRISSKVETRIIGTRYLRFDRQVSGYARLSPSILREFLSYSVTGKTGDTAFIEERAAELESKIENTSRAKYDLAYNIVASMAGRMDYDLRERICFILAGDIVFNMANDVPRPERSTGKMVKGSDMDIVVIVDDSFPETEKMRLDEEIYREKCRLLINPYMKEEIDYIVKNLSRVREQMKFDTFRRMVACKILHEGRLLSGNEDTFYHIKSLLRENRINERLEALEKRAVEFRINAENYLLREKPDRISRDYHYLFYPAEESEEFE